VSPGDPGVELALTPVGGVTVTVGVAGMVDVEVTTTTEGVLETVVMKEVPEVCVTVKGHHVVVVYVTIVTIEPGVSGTAGVEFGLTLVGGVTVAVGVAGTVEVEVTTTTEGVLDTVVMIEVPEVCVAVNGHHVVVV
jgi:hypothetical protein